MNPLSDYIFERIRVDNIKSMGLSNPQKIDEDVEINFTWDGMNYRFTNHGSGIMDCGDWYVWEYENKNQKYLLFIQSSAYLIFMNENGDWFYGLMDAYQKVKGDSKNRIKIITGCMDGERLDEYHQISNVTTSPAIQDIVNKWMQLI